MRHGPRSLLTFATLCAGAAAAQDYPNRPLRFIVPFAPGGGLDITARLIAPGLAQTLGKPVVVDNRPGAGGIIGLEMTARAAPDGHTFAMASASHVIQAVLGINQFDFFRDLAPVTDVIATPYAFALTPALPARSVNELFADGSTIIGSAPAAFRTALEAEHRKWGLVVKRAGIKAN